MKSTQLAIKPTVEIGEFGDLECAMAFAPHVDIPRQKMVTLTMPPTPKGGDEIKVELTEGDWEHKSIYLLGWMGHGDASFPDNPQQIFGFAVRCDQGERLIEALQLALAEADKLGLRTPRTLPSRGTA